MKKLLLSASVAIIALSSCSSIGGSSAPSKLVTMSDSVSYAFGTYVGSSIKQQIGADNEDFDVKMFTAAISSSTKGDSSLLNDQAIQEVLQNYFTNVKPAKDKAKAAAYFEKVMTDNSKAVKTASGLVYEIVELGDTTIKGMVPDTVSVLYTGKDIAGDVFDSTAKRGNTPADLVLGNLVPGFNEGIQLIGKGGKINLWIPAELGYGDKALLFEVEIVDVKKAAPAATTPAPATK